jgi:hypothetical protein
MTKDLNNYIVHLIKNKQATFIYFENDIEEAYSYMKHEFFKYINNVPFKINLKGIHNITFGDIEQHTDETYRQKGKKNKIDILDLFNNNYLQMNLYFDPDNDTTTNDYFEIRLMEISNKNMIVDNLKKYNDIKNKTDNCIICENKKVYTYIDNFNYCKKHYPYPNELNISTEINRPIKINVLYCYIFFFILFSKVLVLFTFGNPIN